MSTGKLTILATPKAFRGHIGVIQWNAITSWRKLVPRPDVFLFGEEEGAAETASELGIGHLRDVAPTEFGTPRLDDLLRGAREVARTPLLAFVNSDIILLQEFLDAVGSVADKLPQFLIVAHRLNIELHRSLDFSAGWQNALRRDVMLQGKPGDHTAIDVFVFSAELYTDAPALALGRAWFDQWMIKAARQRGVPVVDITRVARAIHQNHDYGHIADGQRGAYWGEEALQNLEMYGGAPHAFTLLEATHDLQPDGELRRVRFRREKYLAREWVWRNLVERTASLRSRFGLRRETLRRIMGKRTAR